MKRWIFAARQDAHPGIKALHANYAVGNLDMLRQMYSDKLIQQITRENPRTLLAQAARLQDEATKAIEFLCPNFTTNL